MSDKLNKPYNPKETEDRIYPIWENSGFFKPEKGLNTSGKVFSMVLPPPNVTGTLHLGHAYEDSLQDIFVRYHRMRGDKTLWIPGTDHAAIATQAVVEKELYKTDKKTRHDIGREELLTHIKEFAQKSHDRIIYQIKKTGASLDWSREAFTLDDARTHAVRVAFKKMYDAGLIYRKNRIINWDTKLQTTISDDEVIHEEQKGMFYTFKYSKDFPIAISTTRPETKLGDTAVAVHPEDTRYKKLIGNTYSVEFCGVSLSIKIIGDDAADPKFGTGAVGVTPAHSFIDFEMAERHNLPLVQVINEYGKMMIGNDEIKDKKTTIARDAVVKWIINEGLMEKEEEIVHNIAISDRGKVPIEPLPKLQWFINVNKPFIPPKGNSPITLKEWMKKVIEDGLIQIIPDRFEKTYFNWVDNLRDWCISRQIWYGHQIPIWYRQKGNETETYCGTEPPSENGWEQDPDTLDTWFSSGLWTFSTLGWPEETEDLDIYHPTSVVAPAYEIIFFWVARMILMTGFFLGDIPFRTVYLHGIVRDKNGDKFSKSLGNGIDPIEIIDAYGADALRMGLVVGTGPGNDVKFDEMKIRGYKHFANKIWNASRFVVMNTKDSNLNNKPKLTDKDNAYLAELSLLTQETTNEIEKYNLYLASEKLYHYFWHTFADKIIEEVKERIYNGTEEEKASAVWTLNEILVTCLKLLHPFMPFITEEVWGLLNGNSTKEMLIRTPWPQKF